MIENEQIYDRHIEAANELLQRYELLKTDYPYYNYKFDPVIMEFTPRSTDFYDFTIDDFKLIGYAPIKPQVKLELGI